MLYVCLSIYACEYDNNPLCISFYAWAMAGNIAADYTTEITNSSFKNCASEIFLHLSGN